MAKELGKIITISSRKGGVGKTTCLLNFAGCFSNLKKRVLVIDLDLYSGGVAISLNANNDKTIFNLVEDITNNKFSDIEDYTYKYNEYISVLSSVKDPRQANKINIKYIDQIISIVKHYYDVILIDTSHVLIDLNVVIYDNSDIILHVMSNDPVDLVNTKSFLTIADDVGFSDIRVLLNESFSNEEKYYSLYDIRNFIGKNIDYMLGRNYFIKAIDNYVVEGKILVLNNKLSFKDKKDFEKLIKICEDLLKNK